MIYSAATSLYIRSYTPLHVGIGRAEKTYVDLPIQRDEYGYPVMWASSLKGAIKANVDSNVRRYLGSEPGEAPSKPSAISFLDARLLLIPVRTVNKIWIYATSTHMLNMFKNYLEVLNGIGGANYGLDFPKPQIDKAIVSVKEPIYDGKVMLNEVEVEAKVEENLLSSIGLDKLLPEKIKSSVNNQGIVIIPSTENLDLHIINRSIIIQNRVKLKGEGKVVAEGGLWSEEYLPMESVFVSLILCRDAKFDNESRKSTDICRDIKSKLDEKFIYVGGRETIGKGLVKLYIV